MYVVEITEDKMDSLIEHMSKGIKCFMRAMECLEELKEYSRDREYEEYDEGYDECYGERYGNRGGSGGSSGSNGYGNRSGMRRSRGRYSRY